MAYSSVPLCLQSPSPKSELIVASTSSTSFTPSSTIANTLSQLPLFVPLQRRRSSILARGCRRSWIVGLAPEEEKMTRRSPLDFPIEWDRPKPGRRPDIFPQFSPMKTPLPPPMPADPPEEDEEEEEEKKEEEEEDLRISQISSVAVEDKILNGLTWSNWLLVRPHCLSFLRM